MDWNLEEAIAYYRRQGAPGDQNALISLLKEIQQEHSGRLPRFRLEAVAHSYGIKESFLLAIAKRIPSLRLQDSHVLELCAGPNCGRHTHLADLAERIAAESGGRITVKYVPCMRMCGKGPNLRWDGTLHSGATEGLLKRLSSAD